MLDRKKEVGIVIGSQVGSGNVEIVVKEGETMIVRAEIVIGIMNGGIVTGNLITPALTSQEAVGGHAHDQKSVLETMIVRGTCSSIWYLTIPRLFCLLSCILP